MPAKKKTTTSTKKKVIKKVENINTTEPSNMIDKIKNMSPEEAQSALKFIDNFKNADLAKIKSNAIEKINEMNIPDNFTVKDMLYEELKSWGIEVNNRINLFIDFLCDTITKEKLSSRPSYDDVIKLIDKDGRLTATGFINVLNKIIKDAKFVNSKFFPTLSKIRRCDITPVLLLNQIIDYTYDETE